MIANSAITIDAYISSFPQDSQEKLQAIRQIITEEAPEAVETISYQMPTFKLSGRNLIHFAGYNHHIGLYPTPSPIGAFQKELTAFKTSKGAIQFPLDTPLPLDLIRRIVIYRVKELKNK